MRYLDRNNLGSIVEDSLSTDQRKAVDSARSFFKTRMFDLGLSYEHGDVPREKLGQSVADILKEFKIYLSGSELRDLQKKLDA